MRLLALLLFMSVAGCSLDHAASVDASFYDYREISAQGDEPELPKNEGAQLPEGTAVVGMRQLQVKVSWTEDIDWTRAKASVLHYTWDQGETWQKWDGALERRMLHGKEVHVFTVTFEKDGLLGFYFTNPNTENAAAPEKGTSPRSYVLIDTEKPRAVGLIAIRTSPKTLKLAWSFEDSAPSMTGATISVNGKTILSEQPYFGEADVGVEEGPVHVSVTCTDRARDGDGNPNVSEAMTAFIP